MHFDSLAAALAMDGHGGYVWFVYAVATLVVSWLLLAPVFRGRRAMARARAQLRRESLARDAVNVDEVDNASGS